LSDVLGEDCAESFLFLSLVWTSPTACNKKEGIVINPNRFLECDDHPSFIEAIRQQNKSSSTKEGVTLHQCFQSFSKPERLDVNNMWYCSKCREHVQALKTMKLWKLPNILVVHLKRFEFKHALRRDKLGTFVDFPLTGLSMDPHCAGRKSDEGNNGFVDNNVPADYDLFAVVNHYGRMGFGHYTAFAMENDDDYDDYGKWNVFDDSIVSPIPSTEIPSSAAYILFYRRHVFI
jgi:ubiquitin carboxyl-terminal hydrolase 4/11/15